MMMDRRILVVATSDIHLQVFHLPYFKEMKDKGYTVDVAVEIRGNGEVPFTDRIYNLPFKRTLFSLKLFTAFFDLKKIIEEGNYDLIHCHTPIPAALTRLAASKHRAKGKTVMYTAHGFHFYKGAPFYYWLTYYLAEKYLSKKTDALVTINREDYELAKDRFHAEQTYYIRGIGVDTSKFEVVPGGNDKRMLKAEQGYDANDFILFYAANFIPRKNHQFILKCLIRLKELIPEIKILFAGSGTLLSETKLFAVKNKLGKHVEFLGFRKDIGHLLKITDISISSSKQEGLGLALAEAMISGVPVVASADRGHKELITHGENGFLFEQNNEEEFINYILQLYKDKKLAGLFAERSRAKIDQFSISSSLASMEKIYSNYLSRTPHYEYSDH